MNIEFRKKYEVVKSVIDNCGEESFTIAALVDGCSKVGAQFGMIITLQDVIAVVGDLYDLMEINREVSPNNVISYRKSVMYGLSEDKVSTR